MSAEQIIQIIGAFAGAVVLVSAAIATAVVTIRSAVVKANAPVLTAVAENTKTLGTVHEQTNANLKKAQDEVAAVTAKLDSLASTSLAAAVEALRVSQAEIARMHADAAQREEVAEARRDARATVPAAAPVAPTEPIDVVITKTEETVPVKVEEGQLEEAVKEALDDSPKGPTP